MPRSPDSDAPPPVRLAVGRPGDPASQGALVLTRGRPPLLRIDPSPAMLERMAADEQANVERATRIANAATATLAALAVLAAVAGWLAVRFGGRVRDREAGRRWMKHAALTHTPGGTLTLEFTGGIINDASHRWEAGEYDAGAVEEFVAAYQAQRDRAAATEARRNA